MSPEAALKTVLVTAAGGGAANNLIRALRACRPGLCIVGTNIDRFSLARSLADISYLAPRADTGRAYVDAIRRIVATEQVALVIPQNDSEVAPLGRSRALLGARVLLPGDAAIECCQDKFRLYRHLTTRGVRMADTYEVGSIDDVDAIVQRLGSPERLWCRMRRGSGSMGSLPVSSAAQARFWIHYWEEMRGVPCITEINIGRFFMISPVFHAVGRHNMADLYLRLAFGEAVDVPAAERLDDVGTDDTFLVRELDHEPAVLTRAEIEASFRMP